MIMANNSSNTRKALVEGSTLGAGVLLALALFTMVNYLGMRHYERADWTRSQLYSLSEKSETVARSLDRDVDMVIFFGPGSELYDATSELLDRYAAANPQRIRKREVDPAKNLLEARQLVEQYGIERENVVVIAAGDDRRVIDEMDLAEYDYSGAQMGQAPTLEEFKGEQLITSALLALVEERKPRVLFTTGHGEGPLEAGDARSLSQARDLLGRDNFEIESWAPLGKTEVPANTDLVVVAGPTTSFLPQELALFSSYLERGGRMLWLLDPVFDAAGVQTASLGVEEWLSGYGVELAGDVVIDPSSDLPFFGPETLYTASYGTHPIVEALEQRQTPVLLPLARSVAVGTTPAGATTSELLRTSSEGWGETDLANLDAIGAGEGDIPGPVPLAAAVSWSVTPEAPQPLVIDEGAEDAEAPSADAEAATESRLVVFGDSDFATDAQVANGANALLLLNTLNWLVKREELIDIEGRKPQRTRLTLSDSELNDIYLIVLILLPGLAVAAGIGMYRARRR